MADLMHSVLEHQLLHAQVITLHHIISHHITSYYITRSPLYSSFTRLTPPFFSALLYPLLTLSQHSNSCMHRSSHYTKPLPLLTISHHTTPLFSALLCPILTRSQHTNSCMHRSALFRKRVARRTGRWSSYKAHSRPFHPLLAVPHSSMQLATTTKISRAMVLALALVRVMVTTAVRSGSERCECSRRS